ARHEFKAHGIGVGQPAIDVAAMQKRKAGIVKGMTGGIAALFKSSGVTGLVGNGRLLAGSQVEFTAADGSQRTLSARHVNLASGSVPAEIKSIPQDGRYIVDSWGALEFESVPQTLGVIGAGVISLALRSVWSRLGAKVTILEAADEFLGSADAAIAAEAPKQLRKHGLDVRLGAKVSEAGVSGSKVSVKFADPSGEQSMDFDRLVVAVGRRAFTKDLLGEGTGVALDERGFIVVDEHCRTGAANVFAV